MPNGVSDVRDPGALEWCAVELEFQARAHEAAARQERDAEVVPRLIEAAERCRRGAAALRAIAGEGARS